MEWLTLEGPEPPAVSRPTRAEAVMLSLAAHVLLLLLLVLVPDRLPDVIRRLFAGSAVAATPAARLASSPEARSEAGAPKATPEPRPPESKIPLKFAYVRVPEDAATEKNPQARLLSDRDRRARQEVPTPPEARRFTADPHSEGNSRDRIRLDPARREGPDTIAASPPPAGTKPAGGSGGETTGPRPGPEESQSSPAEPRTAAVDTGVGGTAPDRPPDRGGGIAGRPPGSGTGDGNAMEGRDGPTGDPSARTRPDLQGGTEYKFSFSNPGWLRGQSFGTLSFDTQGFPWGDYARQLYVIIRNNWLARIPLAAREGIAGYTCQHFVIARDGEIRDLEIVRTSSIPPFNKSASDALHASSPLPPLPEEFPNPQEGVTFCFYYNMYPGEAD